MTCALALWMRWPSGALVAAGRAARCQAVRKGILLLLALLALSLALPVGAHSLRLFAKVDGRQVSGYAFFIGGGRPSGVGWVAKMDGSPIAEGKTDTDGAYQFEAPVPVSGDIVITVDTQEGHIATTRLKPQRFESSLTASTPSGAKQSAAAPVATPPPDQGPSQALQRQWVEEAVERQIGPLLERIEAMDTRMSLTDILSGVFLIIGLAGIGLWVRSRRR